MQKSHFVPLSLLSRCFQGPPIITLHERILLKMRDKGDKGTNSYNNNKKMHSFYYFVSTLMWFNYKLYCY